MAAEPLRIARRCDTQHPHASQSQQLNHQAANASGRGGDRDGLTRLGRDSANGRVGRDADDVERTRDLPTQRGRFLDQLVDRDVRVGGVARPLEAETQHLVADGVIIYTVSSPDGKVAGKPAGSAPLRMPISPGLMPAARTSTSTSPAPGDGRSISATYNSSRPP